jgi:hypothetical protein
MVLLFCVLRVERADGVEYLYSCSYQIISEVSAAHDKREACTQHEDLVNIAREVVFHHSFLVVSRGLVVAVER